MQRLQAIAPLSVAFSTGSSLRKNDLSHSTEVSLIRCQLQWKSYSIDQHQSSILQRRGLDSIRALVILRALSCSPSTSHPTICSNLLQSLRTFLRPSQLGLCEGRERERELQSWHISRPPDKQISWQWLHIQL